MKSPPVIIGIVAGALLIIAGVSYVMLSVPSLPEVPPAEHPPPGTMIAPPRESKPLSELPLSFEQKIAGIKKAIADVGATGGSEQVTLVFTETEANNQAARLLTTIEIPADIPLAIESVHVDFQSDNSVLTEARSVIYDTFRTTIKIKAQVSIEEGKPKVEITKVNFGFIPLPRALKDRIAGLVTAGVDDLQRQLIEGATGGDGKVDLEFTDITIQEEEATIAVTIRPGA